MKVTFNHPDFPEGHEFSVTGLNVVFPNGKQVEVSKEELEQYEAATGNKLTAVLKNNTAFVVGAEKGGE